MSRSRARYEYSSRKFWFSPDGSPTYSGQGGNTGITGMTNEFRSYSNIVDNLTPDGVVRSPLYVSHTKRFAAATTDDVVYNYANNPELPSAKVRFVDCRHAWLTTPTLPTPPWGQLASELVGKLDGMIQEGTLLGVTLMELGKTVAMIRNPFNLMRTDWRSVVSKLTARDLASKSANLWLEHRYGWNAMYSDLKSFAKTWNKCAVQTPDLGSPHYSERYSVSSTETLSPPSPLYSKSASSWNAWLAAGIWNTDGGSRVLFGTKSATSRITCRQLRRQYSPFERAYKKLHAFGIATQDILPTLWELVPFSFVVDWFFDPSGLGYPLSKLRLQQGDIRDLCYSTKVVQEFSVQMNCYFGTLLYTLSGPWTGKVATSANRMYIDYRNGSSTFYVRYPGLPAAANWLENCTNAGLSSLQSISAVSLILQKALK